ncbi:uncharacterized protein LOC127530328 isoform X1 [Acanthochromis polyacanthus]|uniref:uncharacterized protein LOC127530328 isoform X1 n=1 Tax=Acanthochromis polyacanthus TaxID=80966 RepID=UPI0022340785|nr:uncharacterized protein LOC127530328 isoform X1 [Acanthochromis polyacanthus]
MESLSVYFNTFFQILHYSKVYCTLYVCSFAGELIGMEYLYSQSGKSLTVMDNQVEEDRLVEQMDDEEVQDEGFVEEEPEDITVPVLYDPSETVPVHSSSPQAFNPSNSASGPPSPQPSTSSQSLPPPQQPPGPSPQRPAGPPVHPPLQHPAGPPLNPPTQRPAEPLLDHPLQHPAGPPLHPSAEPSAASDPTTSTGSSDALQAPVSRLLIGTFYLLFSFEISHAVLYFNTSFLQAAVLGPDGIAGWDKVQNLAEYLVSIRQALYLDEQQVTEVIRLWSALPDGDKRRIQYQPRHQPKLAHGRFKAPMNTGVTPGVDSVKRCLIGHPGGPAQWPSTSRLVEAMCIKLCALHKSPTKKDGVRLPRWTKVLNDYHHIRDLVLNCHTLMEATSLQLFVLNQRTLTQWFNRRENTQELSVLTQGLAAEDRIAVATSQLPAPRERLNEAPSTSGPRHEFVLPPNRAGQALKLRPGRRPASATVVRPIAPAAPPPPPLPAPAPLPPSFIVNPVPVVMGASAGSPSAAPVLAPTPVFPAAPVAPAPTASVSVSRFTQRNRRRRAEEEASGAHKRKYVRNVAFNKCTKCGQPKTKEFGHSRFGSATFCPTFSGGKSLEEWLAEQRQQKKPGNPPP